MDENYTTDVIETDVGESTTDVETTITDAVTEALDIESTTESVPIILVDPVPPVNGVPRFLDAVADTVSLEVILIGVSVVVGAFLIGVLLSLTGGDHE